MRGWFPRSTTAVAFGVALAVGAVANSSASRIAGAAVAQPRACPCTYLVTPSGAGAQSLSYVLAHLVQAGDTVMLADGVYPVENLTLFGRLYRIPERGERTGMLLERFGLWDVRHERVGTFSRGMQQRLGLCRVLLHDPGLLLLDEPSNALDDHGLDLLMEVLADRSRAVAVATHDPARVDRFATARLAFA